jgi:hypothetical protein
MLWFVVQIGYDRVGYDYMDDDNFIRLYLKSFEVVVLLGV